MDGASAGAADKEGAAADRAGEAQRRADARQASLSALTSEHAAAESPVTGGPGEQPVDQVVSPSAAAALSMSAKPADGVTAVPDTAPTADTAVSAVSAAAVQGGPRDKAAMFATGLPPDLAADAGPDPAAAGTTDDAKASMQAYLEAGPQEPPAEQAR